MNKKNSFALVRKPSSAVERAAPQARRILSGMVADTLALAKKEKLAWAKFGIGEFDPEVISAVCELANLYVEGGVTTFEQFAEIVKEEMPSIWNQAKIYLRCVWNQAADMNGLREVSRDEANAIFAAFEQSVEKTPRK